MGTERHAPVLVVDDDDDDLFNFQRAAARIGLANPVVCLHNGEAAVEYLKGVVDGDGRTEPAVVVLDLKMPRMSGFEVLEWLRQQPGLRRLPVVVFTSSSQDPDVHRAYELGANSYLVKPIAFGALVELIGILGLYWLTLNRRPGLNAGN